MSSEIPDHSQSDDELGSFELKLRSVGAAPPRISWMDILESIDQSRLPSSIVEASAERSQLSKSKLPWLRFVTHAAAILIGVSIGALWMSMLPPDTVATSSVGAGLNRVANESGVDDSFSKNAAIQQPGVSDGPEKAQYRVSTEHRFRNSKAFPLTPISKSIHLEHWRSVPIRFESGLLENASGTLDPSLRDKPKSGPELMREMLDEFACALQKNHLLLA